MHGLDDGGHDFVVLATLTDPFERLQQRHVAAGEVQEYVLYGKHPLNGEVRGVRHFFEVAPVLIADRNGIIVQRHFVQHAGYFLDRSDDGIERAVEAVDDLPVLSLVLRGVRTLLQVAVFSGENKFFYISGQRADGVYHFGESIGQCANLIFRVNIQPNIDVAGGQPVSARHHPGNRLADGVRDQQRERNCQYQYYYGNDGDGNHCGRTQRLVGHGGLLAGIVIVFHYNQQLIGHILRIFIDLRQFL